jgi:dipeptidyl aminopeptidase/acylaminoacyl peptidase
MRNSVRRLVVSASVLGVVAVLSAAQAPAKRPLTSDDVYRIQEIADPRCSPDGRWVAYTVTGADREADKRRTTIWMVSWDGTQDVRLTSGADSDSSPRWSPDGRYLSFISSRPAEAKAQVWVLDRRGGEARQLTNVHGDVGAFEWSPDGRRLVLAVQESAEPDASTRAAGTPAPPKPIVIDDYQFKADVDGYLTAASRTHLFVFDVQTAKTERLSKDQAFDDSGPAWSPDGSRIAYVGDRDEESRRVGRRDIFVVEPSADAAPRKLASVYGRTPLTWSPDGRLLAYLQEAEPKFSVYAQERLAVVPAAGGAPRALAEQLDRSVSAPEFSADGASITVLVTDDRSQYPARIPLAGGSVERLVNGPLVVSAQSRGGDHVAVVASTDSSAPEVFALEGGALRKLTSHNDALLSEVQLGAVEDTSFTSKDGTEVHGMMVKPPSYQAGRRYPTILWIHGGPTMQDDHALPFDLYAPQFERQMFAARGYVVLAVNYRGSSGRGDSFARSIAGDWGNKEVADLLAGVDDAVRRGIADPDRLGIGGWSYGGILTDYTIATDPRFKAATSGAGSANQISMYGSDEYVVQYDTEIGPPWRSAETWVRVSYPFFHADRIRTPTLFLGGDQDFNVPIIGSEQMYQALRGLGIPTRLVIYPGQHHLLTRPSFIHDRLDRWIAWFDRWLKPPSSGRP